MRPSCPRCRERDKRRDKAYCDDCTRAIGLFDRTFKKNGIAPCSLKVSFVKKENGIPHYTIEEKNKDTLLDNTTLIDRKGTTIERVCGYCREPFEGDGVSDGVIIYCSDECKTLLLDLENDLFK